MADIDQYVLTAIRKHIVARRLDIAAKFPKNLPRREYLKHCGRHEELEAFSAAVQNAVRKANDAGQELDDAPDAD